MVLQSCRLDCAAPLVMANKRNALGIRSGNLAPSEEPERMEGNGGGGAPPPSMSAAGGDLFIFFALQ